MPMTEKYGPCNAIRRERFSEELLQGDHVRAIQSEPRG